MSRVIFSPGAAARDQAEALGYRALLLTSGLEGEAQQVGRMLVAAIALEGLRRISLLSAGTDGTDGPTEAAGAFVDGATCQRARGLDPGDFLSRHDSYHFFEALGDLLITGPTRTNVRDIICLLIE